MLFDKLFAKNKAGKIKEWEVEVFSNPDGTASFIRASGLAGGTKTSTVRNVKVGKNIGKSNETSPYEQACLDARSRWNKQIDKGYGTCVADLKSAHEVEFFLPMLANRFDKVGKKITWPAFVQPKLDGFRSLARKRNGEVTMWSRKGKVFDVPKELISELNGMMSEGETLDGEIYVHEWRSPSNEADFQRISAATKKHNEDTPLLQYHVYDRPVFGKTFKERFVNKPFSDTQRVKMVLTIECQNEKEMFGRYDTWITGKLPYEGLMVRNITSQYLFAHRSYDLLKVKPLQDSEFKIIGGSEASGNDEGTVVFRCVAENGEEFDVRPKGTRATRAEYWNNLDSYIGQWLTVQYRGRSNSGKPRHAVGSRIRPEWDLDLSEKNA